MLFGNRFPQVSRSMASNSGVIGEEESGIPDSRPLIVSLVDNSQRIKNGENSDTTKEFVALYGCDNATNVKEDGRTTSVDAINGDEESPRTSVEVTDGKREAWGGWGDVLIDKDKRATEGCNGEIVVSDDEENVSWAAEISRCSIRRVPTFDILPDSSHRDGSVYMDTYDGWKKDFRIVDRRESKGSIPHFLFLFVLRTQLIHPPFKS